jgi:YD repeat-containing protein
VPLSKDQKLENIGGLNSFSLSHISESGVFECSNYYKDRYLYDQYDEYFNLTQGHENGNNHISIIWDYNDVYPVIKGENVTYSDLLTAVNSATSNLSDFLKNSIGDLTTPEQKNSWRVFNTTLRLHPILANSLVKTFTYKPLVGITSSTDENGVSTFYEYDNFNRLSVVRDNKGNILKRYNYHYAGQTQSP